MTPKLLRWAAAAAPVVVAALIAATLALSGEQRMLQIGVSIPLVVVLIGVAVSAVVAGTLLARRVRQRSREKMAVAVADATHDGIRREREQHRRFLARLDHELKNPIMAIRAQAAAADETPAWRTVDGQAAKLSTLVRDLRKLAELETRELERENVDLEALICESIAAIIQQHPRTADRFALTVARVPWPVPAVHADLDLLALAMDNVLGNAAKYSQTGPIEVRLREQDGSAIVEVADSGRGIPAEALPLVFDELARAANARDVPGSGLGLTLVATVLRRHGGDIRLRSLPGAGTLATLRLPVQPTE